LTSLDRLPLNINSNKGAGHFKKEPSPIVNEVAIYKAQLTKKSLSKQEVVCWSKEIICINLMNEREICMGKTFTPSEIPDRLD